MGAQSQAESQENAPIPPERSALMARIGQKNTAPEIAVRRVLYSLGVRFRLHRRDLPGTPDVVLPGRRLALLIHGCFWHRHAGCHFAYTPKSRLEFWSAKFDRNVDRDREVERALAELGWRVHVIWECETRDPVALKGHLRKLLARFRARRD
jgi:DNA mismatch endonuclease (patch repair protein)